MGQRASTASGYGLLIGLSALADGPLGGVGLNRSLSGEATLPLDIINAILIMLDQSDMRVLVLLNKNFYRFINKRLWSECDQFRPGTHHANTVGDRVEQDRLISAISAGGQNLRRVAMC